MKQEVNNDKIHFTLQLPPGNLLLFTFYFLNHLAGFGLAKYKDNETSIMRWSIALNTNIVAQAHATRHDRPFGEACQSSNIISMMCRNTQV